MNDDTPRPGFKFVIVCELTRKAVTGEIIKHGSAAGQVVDNRRGNLWWARIGEGGTEWLVCTDQLSFDLSHLDGTKPPPSHPSPR